MTAQDRVDKRQRISDKMQKADNDMNAMFLETEHHRLFALADISTKVEMIKLEGDLRSDDLSTMAYQDVYDMCRSFGFSVDYLIIDTINNIVRTSEKSE